MLTRGGYLVTTHKKWLGKTAHEASATGYAKPKFEIWATQKHGITHDVWVVGFHWRSTEVP